VKQFKLPNAEHATAVVANRIMHLPPDQDTTTMEYLGACVRKNVAYQVAESQGRRIAHKIQVDMIVTELKANPLNQQAMDALEKAVNEGSEYAKQARAGLSLEPSHAKVLNLVEKPPESA